MPVSVELMRGGEGRGKPGSGKLLLIHFLYEIVGERAFWSRCGVEYNSEESQDITLEPFLMRNPRGRLRTQEDCQVAMRLETVMFRGPNLQVHAILSNGTHGSQAPRGEFEEIG